jgi:hypothetical protein
MAFVVNPVAFGVVKDAVAHRLLWLESALRAAFLSALISLLFRRRFARWRRVSLEGCARESLGRASVRVDRCERVVEWRRDARGMIDRREKPSIEPM